MRLGTTAPGSYFIFIHIIFQTNFLMFSKLPPRYADARSCFASLARKLRAEMKGKHGVIKVNIIASKTEIYNKQLLVITGT